MVSIRENFALPFVPFFEATAATPVTVVPYPLILAVPRPTVIFAGAGPLLPLPDDCTLKSRALVWQSMHCFLMTTVDCAASVAAAKAE